MAEFGQEFSREHREYLLDLYSQFVQTTRSNSELEFGEIIFHNDLKDKLASLERMIEQQPEGSCGVPLSDRTPSEMMRGATMKLKGEEKQRLSNWLAELEKENDILRPQIEEKLSEVVVAASSLRARKQACERMLVAAQHA